MSQLEQDIILQAGMIMLNLIINQLL